MITRKLGVTVQKVKITGKNISLSIAIITIKTTCQLISKTLKNNLREPAVVRKKHLEYLFLVNFQVWN